MNSGASHDKTTSTTESILELSTFTSPPKVSFVVTNYNYEKYIEACLQSIAAQKYPHFECLIVDDHSSDNSTEIIRNFIDKTNDNRFQLIPRNENGGQMASILTGLECASGVFLVCVDADDILFPNFLDIHVNAHLNNHYSVAFSSSDQASINAEGQLLAKTCPTLMKERKSRSKIELSINWGNPGAGELTSDPLPTIHYLPAHSAYHMDWFWGTTSTMMFRRSVLSLILGEHCSHFRVCADYYLATFSQAIGGSLTIDKPLGAYRRHGKNAYTSENVLGGERSCDDVTSHPPYGQFNHAFSLHLLNNFDSFFSLLDQDHSHSLLARFSSPKLFRRILFARLRTNSKFLSRKRLLVFRIMWMFLRQERRVAKTFAIAKRYIKNRP